MAFHRTSHTLVLSSNPGTLTAQCRSCDGTYKPATLNLDAHIGNRNGAFLWGGVNFSQSARHVRLLGSRLVAVLCDRAGDWHTASLELGERVVNVDGALKVVGEQKKKDNGGAERREGDEEEDLLSTLFGSFFPEPRRVTRSAANARLQPQQEENDVGKDGERKPVGDGAALAAAQLATQSAAQSGVQKTSANAAARTSKEVSQKDKKSLAFQVRKLLLSGEYDIIGEPGVSLLGLANRRTGEVEMSFKVSSVVYRGKSHVQDKKEEGAAPVVEHADKDIKAERIDEKKVKPIEGGQAGRKEDVKKDLKEDTTNATDEAKKVRPVEVEEVSETEDDIDSEWELA